MPDRAVTVHAANGVIVPSAAAHDLVNEIAVATETVVLQDLAIRGLNTDRFVKESGDVRCVGGRRLKREAHRVMIAVASLGQVLREELRRHMAVVTRSHCMVWPLAPRIELIIHDVAIRTRARIVAEIRKALGVTKCEAANSGERPYQCR